MNGVPTHVPAELVREFDFIRDPGVARDPHGTLTKLWGFPRVFYNPLAINPTPTPGSWVVTRAADIRALLTDTETFSSKGSAGFASFIGESWDLIPTEADPPAHAGFRRVLNPIFSPQAVRELEGRIRAHASNLIAKMSGNRCEFVHEFGQPFPILIFLSLMGLPGERFPEFFEWVRKLLHGVNLEERGEGARAIVNYLRAEIAARKRAPGDDVISRIVTAEVDGRKMTDDELLGMVFLTFSGGLDTVVASIGFHFRHLATHPEAQQRLRAEPELIPAAIEEMFRAFGIVTPNRRVTRDTTFAGVNMKAGDWVMLPLPLANLDPAETSDPLQVNFERTPIRHVTFSYGPHFCVGAHLARLELKIAMEEWLKLPPFRLADPNVPTYGGALVGISRMHLTWS